MQVFIRQYSGLSTLNRPLPQQDAIMLATDRVLLWQQALLQTELQCAVPVLLAVADGVSASPAAALASRTVLKQLALAWQQEMLVGKQLNSTLLRHCQRVLTAQLGKKPASFGAATTVAVLEIAEGRFKAIHAGDSRIWRYRQGVLTQLTVDHSFASELTHLTSQPLAQCYRALTSYLAADEAAEDFVLSVIDGTTLPGDQFLLTTDGIHDEISPDVLSDCLAAREAGVAKLDVLLSQPPFRDQLSDNASLLWLCC